MGHKNFQANDEAGDEVEAHGKQFQASDEAAEDTLGRPYQRPFQANDGEDDDVEAHGTHKSVQ